MSSPDGGPPRSSVDGNRSLPAGPRIVVLGSINLDLVIRSQRLPAAGETVIARSSTEVCGGKGANQAVAAARMGGQVAMIGAVGNDAYGRRMRENLERSSIQTAAVATADSASGLAVVAVDDQGQNQILVSPGANFTVTADQVDQQAALLADCDTLLCQLELPIATVLHAVRLANQLGKRVILDPAPVPTDFPPSLFAVGLLCPNQTEAEQLLGHPIGSTDQALQAVQQLVRRGCGGAIITLGGDGAVICDGQRSEWLPPHDVPAVDSTAAGDAFAGALAAAWHADRSLAEAARLAMAAAALSVTRPGAQPSLPTEGEVQQWLAQR